MAEIDEKIDVPVEIPADEPVVVKIDDEIAQKPAPEAAEETVDDREKAVEELRRQLEREKQARAAEEERRAQLEAYAREQAERLHAAKGDLEEGQLRTILNALDATEQTAQAAERAYADAMAAGDYAAAAKAQRAISQCEAHLNDLAKGKRALEARLQAPAEGRVRDPRDPLDPRAPPPPQDPLEAMAARLTPKSAEWLRAHPQAVGQVSKLTAAHSAAVELEGLAPETPEYFAYIEQRLGYTQSEKKPGKPAKPAVPSAPVSSGASSGGPVGSSMTLSPAEVEMAILQEPTLPREKALELYARNKAALIKEGKLR